jgi:hypothetical protein
MPIPGVNGVSDDQLFGALNVCLLGWGLLALPPSWRPRHYEAVILFLCALFGALYSATLAAAVASGEVPQGAGFDTLEGVALLFRSRAVVFSGWVHYVCFDLLAGLFITRDNETNGGIPHAVIALLVLPLTLLAGPSGLLVYLALKLVWPPRRGAAAPSAKLAGKKLE